jgi:hypothetical protein
MGVIILTNCCVKAQVVLNLDQVTNETRTLDVTQHPPMHPAIGNPL